MHVVSRVLLVATLCVAWTNSAMAIEEAKYTVVERDGRFDLRDYTPHVLAETLVGGTLGDAGNQAFNRLFRYISGANTASTNLAMTAPVSQEASVKIPMTAPVSQEATGNQWAVSFMMPAGHTLESLPAPSDSTIKLRLVPARRMAAVRYSGTWSEHGYTLNKTALQTWIASKGLTINGEPVWARYNPPFTLWFWRRNEILIPVSTGTH